MSKTITITVSDEEYSDLLNLGRVLRDSTRYPDNAYTEYSNKVKQCSYEMQLATLAAIEE